MAYTELSSSLMKRTAEISLDYNKSKRSASLSFSGGASSMDLLGSALGGGEFAKDGRLEQSDINRSPTVTANNSLLAPHTTPTSFSQEDQGPSKEKGSPDLHILLNFLVLLFRPLVSSKPFQATIDETRSHVDHSQILLLHNALCF